MQSIKYQKDEHNIVHVILDRPDSAVNLMDATFNQDLKELVQQLKQDDFIGVIVRSEKTTFFAGGDIDMLFATGKEDAKQAYDLTMEIKNSFRAIENLGKPVVACIAGSALGGGFETALACNHRIAVDDSKIKLGLPEVNLGLLPGAGGVTRMVRLLGIELALPYLAEGRMLKPTKAHELGLIQQLVEATEELVPEAINFIKANPEVAQPWDKKGYKIPGGKPTSPALAQKLVVAPAMMRQKTRGNLPAPEKILCTMVEGATVDFDSALRIESRYFTELVTGQVSKNLINTFWYQQNEINGGKNRPDFDKTQYQKIGVLGAGMMGAGIAYAAAIKGIDVVLKDVSLENAEKGKGYSSKLLEKQVQRGRMTQQAAEQILQRIVPTENVSDLSDCDMVIEAVFEDSKLKAKVTQETEAVLPESVVFASNTSTLPITGLAENSRCPEQFIGIHFFSPVDKMPLIEIICGKKTSDETLAKAYDLCLQLGKTPIVVNDSRGFFTSRVFSTFVKEGVMMLGETSATEIENAAWSNGFPVGPLAVNDEVTLVLFDKINKQTQRDLESEGKTFEHHPADAIVENMLAMDRKGKATGAGFYEYPENGKKSLWPELGEHFNSEGKRIPFQDTKDRLLYIMSLETVKCLDEQVLRSVGDANIGSVFGIGFPAWTGGALQFINSVGISEFVSRAQELANIYGERFTPPASLLAMAEKGKRF